MKDLENNRTSLVVLVADHGMADQGGHGASSTMEVKTPLFIFNSKYVFKRTSAFKEFKQIDFASTISCLFNLKIPEHNEGIAFISEFVGDQSTIDEKFAFTCMLNNFMQLNEGFNFAKETDAKQKLTQIFEELEQKTGRNLGVLSMNIENILRSIDIGSINKNHNQNNDLKMQLALLLMFIVSESFLRKILDSELLLFSSFSFKCLLKFVDLTKVDDWKRQITEKKFEFLTFVLYLMSLFSSSFVEEEHQLWYYFEMTYILLIIGADFKHKFLEQFNKNKLEFVVNACLLLIVMRVIRTFNQTGNKWINEKDFGDWLREYNKIICCKYGKNPNFK